VCLVLVAFESSLSARFVLAANRDEFHERPTEPAAFWDERPGLLAGRDLRAGGTWLGVTRSGRVAALTNYREPSTHRVGAFSRGELVVEFLEGRESGEEYLARIAPVADRYNGFNLLLYDGQSLWSFANTNGERARLSAGLYGLSNHLLETPWPKVVRTKARLARLLEEPHAPQPWTLLMLLSDRTRAADHQLPRTGVSLEWERLLSAPFIVSPTYGTRSSTALVIDASGMVRFAERSFRPDGEATGTVEESFPTATAGAPRSG
jgi:uncharacterized protein with NRDE domain